MIDESNKHYSKLFKANSPTRLWDLFTSKEEYTITIQDKFNRNTSYISKNKNIFTPQVSEYIINQNYKFTYPNNKSFAICLTHDIDSIYSSLIHRIYCCVNAISLKKRKQFSQSLKNIFNKKYPLLNFHHIMDLEESYGAKSSFYFLALKQENMDFNYDIRNLKNELSAIDRRGWEVGLHGGHEAWNSYEKLMEEKTRLEDVFGKSVIGYRNHYLHFKVPETWEYLAGAGFKYDTTFGYADCVGFRNGMCHPYYPYNLNTEKYINIIEIPLIVMDCTLFDSYMRLTKEDALTLIKDLIDKVAELHGVFTLLWHNSYLIKGTWELDLYENILAYCQEKNAWMTSGKEIYQWFVSEKNE